MRIYRNGIILCIFMCVGSFAPLLCNIVGLLVICSSLENLLLGVFASAFVALITYVGAYTIEKRKTIGLLNKFCADYIMEWSNLIPLLVDVRADGTVYFRIDKVVEKIKTDPNVHHSIKTLCKIHEDRLYSVDGYFPILKKAPRNLTVHHLIIEFARINCAIQYCDRAYMLSNNIVYQLEKEDIPFSDEELVEYIKVILQHENTDYQKFLKLAQKVLDMRSGSTVFDPKCEDKCS